MGHINQLRFIEKNKDLVKGPVLEIGSKDYGNTQDLRSIVVIAIYKILKIFPLIFSHPHIFPPVGLSMIGKKVK